MTTLYQQTVPVFRRFLLNLHTILGKAAEHAVAAKVDPSVYLNDRLYPDMYPLTRQIQIASDIAKGAVSRLVGREPPRFDDVELTVGELQARIDKTVTYLDSFSEADFFGGAEREVQIKAGGRELQFRGIDYLNHYALPNFYFHVTTAYAILRHDGVPLIKGDYLGSYQTA